MLEVYLDPCTVNSRKVLAGLGLLGTKYHFNHVDYFKGEHKSPEYLKINPHGTVPAAVDGDLHLTESNAILQYAADLGDVPSSAYPKDIKKRADVNRWLLWETSMWFPSCYVYLVENVVKPLLKQQPDEAIINGEAGKWNSYARILDNRLEKSKWLCGDEVSIADIAVASPMHLHRAQRLPLEEHPNLKRWLTEGIEKLACWSKTQEAVDKALLPGVPPTNGDITTNGQQGTVKGEFNYTKQLDKPPEIYFYDTEAAKTVHEPGDDPRETTVTDGWPRAPSFSVDKEGFALHDFHTDFTAWEDQDRVQKEFYPEVVSFLKASTGASRVVVFDHTIRTRANAAKKVTEETNTSQRAPVRLVHCDYTAESAPVRVEQLLPDEAADLLTRRVAFLNVWKPIHNVVEELPLAMCDVTSTSPDDFFKLYLRYRDRNGENYVLRYSDKHKWWYFPQMTPEKVIVLKTYDSDDGNGTGSEGANGASGGRARFVGHSAFQDPNTPADAKTRESVEIRTMAFF